MKTKKSKAYIIRNATIEPYLKKFLEKSKYVSQLSEEAFTKIRREEEAYANHNRFSFLCNF